MRGLMYFDYSSKYEKTNIITSKIINNFYANIGECLNTITIESALEVGCGPGYSTQKIKDFLPNKTHFVAGDLEPELVDLCRKLNTDLPIQQLSIYELPFSDCQFDLVISLEVLEHLESPERAMQELLRVSKRWILVSVPREPIWCLLNLARGKYLKDFGNTPGHIQHWSLSSFERFLKSFGNIKLVKCPLPWSIILLDKMGNMK